MKKLLLLTWFLVGCTEQVTEQQVEECTEDGIAYFKSIGSYPNLISNGKSAEQVAAERCNVSITAFDPRNAAPEHAGQEKVSPIVIKNIYIGMPKNTFENTMQWDGFFGYTTIGGVEVKLLPYFSNNGKLTKVAGIVPSTSINDVISAINSKYSMACDNEMLSNAFGMSYPSIKCELKTTTEYLSISRIKVTEYVFTFEDIAELRQVQKEIESNKLDI